MFLFSNKKDVKSFFFFFLKWVVKMVLFFLLDVWIIKVLLLVVGMVKENNEEIWIISDNGSKVLGIELLEIFIKDF